jgi:hypothetical protein
VPLLELRRLSGVLDRLFSAEQAARNARAAAWAATRTVREREAVERDVEAITYSADVEPPA